MAAHPVGFGLARGGGRPRRGRLELGLGALALDRGELGRRCWPRIWAEGGGGTLGLGGHGGAQERGRGQRRRIGAPPDPLRRRRAGNSGDGDGKNRGGGGGSWGGRHRGSSLGSDGGRCAPGRRRDAKGDGGGIRRAQRWPGPGRARGGERRRRATGIETACGGGREDRAARIWSPRGSGGGVEWAAGAGRGLSGPSGMAKWT